MSILQRVLGASLLLLALSPSASAQVVYDEGEPNEGVGWDIWGDQLAADDFEFNSPFSFDMIRFWGLSNDPLSTGSMRDIFWKLFLDNGSGAPGTAVAGAEGTASASITQRSGTFWQFDLLVGSQSLGPGVYWLALNAPTMDDMIWETSTGGRGNGFVQSYTWDQVTWGDVSGPGSPGNLAFQLHDTSVVPEPVSMVLLGTGLAGLGALRRRRRKPYADPVS